jgi:hypothetical protein
MGQNSVLVYGFNEYQLLGSLVLAEGKRGDHVASDIFLAPPRGIVY